MNATPNFSAWRKLFLVYAGLALLLVLPSATLWFNTPFRVLEHNFNWFCGLSVLPGWNREATALLGRFIQAIIFAASGWCFFRLATRHADAIEAAPRRSVAIAVGILLLIYLAGLPWLNPDMFWAIGRGWVDAHYGFEPYLVPTRAVPGFASDPMFANIDPGLLKNAGNYGPIHHSIAAILAGLSGGHIKVATLLFKLLNLGVLLGSAAIFYRLARRLGLKAQHLTFCFLANPIVPLVFLAWGHNDMLQNLFLLLALLCIFRERPLLSGCALGAAIATKYVAIVLLPALLIYWFRAQKNSIRGAALSLLGIIGVVGYTHTLYEGSWTSMLGIYTVGWSPIRSSIYCVLVPLVRALDWQTLAPFRLALAAIYLVGGTALTFGLLWKRPAEPLQLVKVCVWIFNLYFLVAAPAVLEWYLTWNVACLLLLTGYFRSFSILYAFYMVLVPFTLYLPDPIQYPINIALYLFFAVSAFWLAPWRERVVDKTPRVAPEPAPCA